MRAAAVLALMMAGVLAGCLEDQPAPGPATGDPAEGGWRAGPALWDDPQNAPHAAYGWPTLSHPPAGTLPAWWTPIEGVELPETIDGLQHVAAAPEKVQQGAGIALFGRLAFVPGFGEESFVVDIADPLRPRVLSTIHAEASHRGAAFVAYPDGRLVVTVSTGPGFDVYDVTDPAHPLLLNRTEPSQQGGHKLGVVPGTPILYNAGSDGGHNVESLSNGFTEIFDLTDPSRPVKVQDFQNGFSCHHVYFWNDPENDKHRALCAGIDYTQIWDTADPLDPEVIVSVPVHHGVAGTPSAAVTPWAFSHFAGLSRDGTVLLVGDEMGGGGYPPGCVLGVHTPAGSVGTPLGALWFYDVSDETNPTLQGWFTPGQHFTTHQESTSCTAHHGRLVPAGDRDLIAMSFYGAGVTLIDFTDPTLPVRVDQFNDGTNTWETWYNAGYLFTGDLSRGMDVLTFR